MHLDLPYTIIYICVYRVKCSLRVTGERIRVGLREIRIRRLGLLLREIDVQPLRIILYVCILNVYMKCFGALQLLLQMLCPFIFSVVVL